jgi:hypothetical protein
MRIKVILKVIVAFVCLNVLHAGRQIQVWTNPSRHETPKELVQETGINKPKICCVSIFDERGLHQHGIFEFTDPNAAQTHFYFDRLASEEDSSKIPNGMLSCIPGRGFYITNTTAVNVKRVKLIRSLKICIKKEFNEYEKNVQHSNPEEPCQACTVISDLVEDFNALRSIPPTTDPKAIIVLPERRTIVLFFDAQGTLTYYKEQRILPKNFVVIKLSDELFNNLWKLTT